MPLDKALALIQRRRPEAEPIAAFVDMLRQYEQQCVRDGVIVLDNEANTATNNNNVKKRAAVGPSRGPEPSPAKRSMIGPVVGRHVVAVGPQPQPIMGPSLPPAKAEPDEPSPHHSRSSSSSLSNESSSGKVGNTANNQPTASPHLKGDVLVGSSSSSKGSASTDESVKH